jgi:hypothetical protein
MTLRLGFWFHVPMFKAILIERDSESYRATLTNLHDAQLPVTGRCAESDFLKQLGASEILDRAQFATAGKPLAKERWAAAIDVVGSHTLDFPATMAPHLARHYPSGH